MQNSPFGMAHLWAQSDGVIHSVAILLLLMSLASWSVIIIKGWTLFQMKRMRVQSRAFWHAVSYQEGLEQLPGRHNPFRTLAITGQEAAAHHEDRRDELHGVLNLSDWLTSALRQSIDESTQQLQAGLAILASVGSTAPFIGLFGTVWGIYHALLGIGATGSASLEQVAGPVGESLVMTALGLAVAIPAVLGYNALTRGNRDILAGLRHFAHDLHAYLIMGKRVTTPPTGAA